MRISKKIFSIHTTAYLLLFLMLVCSLSAIAQDNKTKAVDSLLVLARKQQREAQFLPMLKTGLQTLELAESLNYDRGIGDAHYLLGSALSSLGMIDEALPHLAASEETGYYRENPFMQVQVHRIRGQAFVRIGLYQQALEEYDKQARLFPDLKKDRRLWSAMQRYSNLSYLYGKKEEDKAAAADSLKKYARLQMEVMAELPEEWVANEYLGAYSHLSWAYILEKNYNKSLAVLDSAMVLVRKYKLPIYYNLEIDYSEVALHQNQIEKAKIHLERLLDNLRTIGDRRALRNQYKYVAGVYAEYKLNQDTADLYLLRSNLLRDSLESENKKAIDRAMSYLLQAKEKEKEGQLMRYVYRGAVALLLLACLLTYLVWKTRRNKKVLAKKEEVILEERRLNSSLHESIQQNKFEQLLELAKENSPEFLTLFTELYPDFIAALKDLAPKIRNTELEFCAMSYLNFTTKNIAEYTFVTIRAVQIRKNRLRKKLNIPSDIDFNNWMQGMGCVEKDA